MMNKKPGDLDWTSLLNKGTVTELRPEYNQSQKRKQRAKVKDTGKDPLHQPVKDFKHIETQEASKLTGGKKGWYAKDKGVSEAGAHQRMHKPDDPSFFLEGGKAKSKHKEVLTNLKAQKKPNLIKAELLKFNDLGQWSLAKSKDGEHIKDCQGCGTKMTTKNSEYIGRQKLSEKPGPNDLHLWNCPGCKTTVSQPVKDKKNG